MPADTMALRMAPACLVATVLGLVVSSSAFLVPGGPVVQSMPPQAGARLRGQGATFGESSSSSWAFLSASAAATAMAAAALRRSAMGDAKEDAVDTSRRGAALATGAALFTALMPEAFAETKAVEVDLPPKITSDPYELIGIEAGNSKQDGKEFGLRRNYKEDTYQVVKHMKISASLDKGTPNLEQFQKRVKREMNDWVALYRRQDAVVGRQSYYSLYSAINTLASHFSSYGPKFPFPNKRRQRFYQLINQTEKYLDKSK